MVGIYWLKKKCLRDYYNYVKINKAAYAKEMHVTVFIKIISFNGDVTAGVCYTNGSKYKTWIIRFTYRSFTVIVYVKSLKEMRCWLMLNRTLYSPVIWSELYRTLYSPVICSELYRTL